MNKQRNKETNKKPKFLNTENNLWLPKGRWLGKIGKIDKGDKEVQTYSYKISKSEMKSTA